MTIPSTPSWRAVLLLVGLLAFSTAARAERGPDSNDAPSTAAAAFKGQANCTLGSAEIDININNVRATLYNIGGLFWRGSGAQYEVPAGSGTNSIFASGIWVAGLYNGDDTDLRFAGATYSSWEFWPGPLDETGETTQQRCSNFDRFWRVDSQTLTDFVDGVPEGTTRADGSMVDYTDVEAWPIAQGAPFFEDTNGNGKRDPETEPLLELDIDDPGYSTDLGGGRQINPNGGELPEIIGDQGIWWVMNDNGNTHGWSGKPALKMEIRALVFAFETADAINNTTFYRYQFVYRNDQPLEESYIALWSDPDLGQFGDDYVGSDTDLGLGFVYNGDNFDEGAGNYGALPPALGYDFFQGPLVDADGIDNNGNGEIDEDDERLQVETFFYFTNQGGPTGDPAASDDRGLVSYRYMQGLWKDGVPLTVGGDGYNPGSENITQFAFPADPPAFWSEYNSDGLGRANAPDDRRFGVSTGPFTFQPDDVQEIVFGIVWSIAPQQCQSSPTPQIASLQQLKFDDISVQGLFNANFQLPSPPPAVSLTGTALDQAIVLEFDSVTGDNDDLFTYNVESPFAPAGAPDETYNFEGFKIFQYRGPSDTQGTLIKTLDLNNSVTTVIDSRLDCNTGAVIDGVVAEGENSGGLTLTPTSFLIEQDVFTGDELRNNTSYYFGVQPYAYNEFSSPNKVFAAPVSRVEVRPSLSAPRDAGTVINAQPGSSIPAIRGEGTLGEGIINARVVNPAALTGDTYRVVFYTQNDEDGAAVGTNFDIVNQTTGAVIFDGREYYATTGVVAPQIENIARVDGLAFDVAGPDARLNQIVEVIDGEITDSNLALSLNSAANPPRFFVSANGASSGASILTRTDWQGGAAARVPIDYEIRFVEDPETNGQIIFNRQWDGADNARAFMTQWIEADAADLVLDDEGEPTDIVYTNPVLRGGPDGRMPFQVWEINGPNGPRQVSAAIIDDTQDLIYSPSLGQLTYAFGNSNAVYERIYLRTMDYDEAAMRADPLAAANAFFSTQTTVGRVLFVPFGGHVNLPAPGTTIRYVTTKPNLPGDEYAFNTADFAATRGDAETAQSALDLIAITPNPYRGFSEYESSGNSYIARIVNLPAQATVRIFTLNGTLLRTLEKNNASRTTIDWDLRTEANLTVASGLYLIHVEARDADGTSIGERVLKFGVVQRRVQLDVF